MKIDRIASFFLLASIATLFIGEKTIFLFFKINDLFLLASVSLFVIGIIARKIPVIYSKKNMLFFLLWSLTTIFGTILSLFIYRHIPLIDVLKEYARLCADFLITCLTIYYAQTNPYFLKQALIALCTGICVPLSVYVLPQEISIQLFDAPAGRFTGLFFDPNYYASFQIIPTIVMFFFMFKQYTVKKNYAVPFLLFVLASLSVGTIVWSGSRSGFIGLVCAMATLWLLSFFNSSKKITSFLLLFLMGTSFFVGILLLPPQAHQQIASRLNVVTIPSETVDASKAAFSGRQDRFTLWVNSLAYIKENPLGYGPTYHEIINIIGDSGNEHRVAHNTLLEIVLTGGIGLLVLVGFLFFYFTKNIFIVSNELGIEHVLYASAIGLSGSAFFIDCLYYRWLWVVGALLYSALSLRNTEKSKNEMEG